MVIIRTGEFSQVGSPCSDSLVIVLCPPTLRLELSRMLFLFPVPRQQDLLDSELENLGVHVSAHNLLCDGRQVALSWVSPSASPSPHLRCFGMLTVDRIDSVPIGFLQLSVLFAQ